MKMRMVVWENRNDRIRVETRKDMNEQQITHQNIEGRAFFWKKLNSSKRFQETPKNENE